MMNEHTARTGMMRSQKARPSGVISLRLRCVPINPRSRSALAIAGPPSRARPPMLSSGSGDAATATGAAAASATTSLGPWAVTLDTTTSPPQATASLAFDDGDVILATLQADHGSLLSSNAEPYNLEDGWHLDYERDNDGVPRFCHRA